MRTVLVRTALVLACLVCSSASFADNCDNKCRMRRYFFVWQFGTSGGGYYWKYSHDDCFLCVRFAGATGGGVCETYGPYTNTTCTVSGTNVRRKYSTGDLRCDCDDPSKWFIESFEPSGPLAEPMACERYVCPGIAIPVEL